MAVFQVTISTDNAAFEGELVYDEVARLLKEAATEVEAGGIEGDLHDLNGNKVGIHGLIGNHQFYVPDIRP